jgi:hypothetical protein
MPKQNYSIWSLGHTFEKLRPTSLCHVQIYDDESATCLRMMRAEFGSLIKPMKLVIAAVLLLATTAAFAQQPVQTCGTYLTMYIYDERIGLILAPGMTTDQAQWYGRKGKRDNPGFCFSPEKATYVMVTFRWTVNQERAVTRNESAVTTGPVTTVVGQSSSGPGQPAQPIWRTQLGTFVTTWQTQAKETVREPHALVQVFETKDGKPLSPTTELRPDPVIQAEGAGRNAGRDALDWILKNWNMKLASKSH